jgi:hypothetical protein
MNLNRLTAREKWFRIGTKADLARVRTHKVPMAVLWLVVFCAFPSINRAQVPVYEVTPVESGDSDEADQHSAVMPINVPG